MRVLVDQDRCDGFGYCEQRAPGVFRLDDAGDLTILVDEVPPSGLPEVEAAVRACPVAALRIDA